MWRAGGRRRPPRHFRASVRPRFPPGGRHQAQQRRLVLKRQLVRQEPLREGPPAPGAGRAGLEMPGARGEVEEDVVLRWLLGRREGPDDDAAAPAAAPTGGAAGGGAGVAPASGGGGDEFEVDQLGEGGEGGGRDEGEDGVVPALQGDGLFDPLDALADLVEFGAFPVDHRDEQHAHQAAAEGDQVGQEDHVVPRQALEQWVGLHVVRQAADERREDFGNLARRFGIPKGL